MQFRDLVHTTDGKQATIPSNLRATVDRPPQVAPSKRTDPEDRFLKWVGENPGKRSSLPQIEEMIFPGGEVTSSYGSWTSGMISHLVDQALVIKMRAPEDKKRNIYFLHNDEGQRLAKEELEKATSVDETYTPDRPYTRSEYEGSFYQLNEKKLLQYLRTNRNRKVTLEIIAEYIGCSSPTAGSMVRKLMYKGLVTRKGVKTGKYTVTKEGMAFLYPVQKPESPVQEPETPTEKETPAPQTIKDLGAASEEPALIHADAWEFVKAMNDTKKFTNEELGVIMRTMHNYEEWRRTR